MSPLPSEVIASRLESIRAGLPSSARLVAVSKFHPADYVVSAYEAGQRLFGESRVQELVGKWERLHEAYPDIVWHFIGPLQTNKVKYIAPFISMIESVTSERLLREICRQAQRVGRTIPVLLELHVAQEETKSGFARSELLELLGRIHAAPTEWRGIELRGLMAMASNVPDEDQVAREFAEVRTTFESLRTSGLLLQPESFTELSMGMSGDYQIALSQGSTLVRIGSAIFGERL
nr:YggS family pyridoxal phosphate-dependent enzyme [uncultured Porphyromonas sp.]